MERGLRARVRRLGSGRESQVVQLDHTKFNFYSKSSTIHLMIEMS